MSPKPVTFAKSPLIWSSNACTTGDGECQTHYFRVLYTLVESVGHISSWMMTADTQQASHLREVALDLILQCLQYRGTSLI